MPMEQEDKDRLTRVEMKLDQFAPLIPLIERHDRHLWFMGRIMGFLGAAITLLFTLATSIFEYKKH